MGKTENFFRNLFGKSEVNRGQGDKVTTEFGITRDAVSEIKMSQIPQEVDDDKENASEPIDENNPEQQLMQMEEGCGDDDSVFNGEEARNEVSEGRIQGYRAEEPHDEWLTKDALGANEVEHSNHAIGISEGRVNPSDLRTAKNRGKGIKNKRREIKRQSIKSGETMVNNSKELENAVQDRLQHLFPAKETVKKTTESSVKDQKETQYNMNMEEESSEEMDNLRSIEGGPAKVSMRKTAEKGVYVSKSDHYIRSDNKPRSYLHSESHDRTKKRDYLKRRTEQRRNEAA